MQTEEVVYRCQNGSGCNWTVKDNNNKEETSNAMQCESIRQQKYKQCITNKSVIQMYVQIGEVVYRYLNRSGCNLMVEDKDD